MVGAWTGDGRDLRRKTRGVGRLGRGQVWSGVRVERGIDGSGGGGGTGRRVRVREPPKPCPVAPLATVPLAMTPTTMAPIPMAPTTMAPIPMAPIPMAPIPRLHGSARRTQALHKLVLSRESEGGDKNGKRRRRQPDHHKRGHRQMLRCSQQT